MGKIQFVLLFLATLVAGYPDGAVTCIVESGYGDAQTPRGPKGLMGGIYNSNVGPVVWNTSATSYSPDVAIPITISGDTFKGFLLTSIASGTTTRIAGTYTMSDMTKINTNAGWPTECRGKTATHSGNFGTMGPFVVNFQIAPGLTFTTTPTVEDGSFPAKVAVNLATTGNVYYVLLAQGQAQPTAAQIRNPAGISPAPRDSGTIPIATASTLVNYNITQLDEETPYDLYLLGEQTSGATLTNINFLSYVYRVNSNWHYNTNVCQLPPMNSKPTTVSVKLSFTSGTGTPRTPQNVTFTLNPNTVTIGSTDITLSATTTGNLTTFTYTSSNVSVATISGNKLTIVGTGKSTITAIQPGDAYWARATATQLLTVNKGTQKIVFPLSLSTTLNVGDLLPLFASVNSGLGLTYSVDNGGAATIIDGSILNATAAGTVTLTATQAGNANYNPATNSTTITIQALAPPTDGTVRFTIDIQGVVLPNANSSQARNFLLSTLATQAGVNTTRLSIVFVKTSDQDGPNATTYTVDIAPATGTDPASDAVLTNLTESAADPQSSVSMAAASQGLAVISVLPPGFYYGLVVNGAAYKFNMYLALDGKFDFYWLLTPTAVQCALRKQTNGWIGFGWAHSQSAPYMVGSSVTVGWNIPGTNMQAADYYLGGQTSSDVAPNSKQNVTNADTGYVSGFTTLVWTRPFNPTGGAIAINPEVFQTVIYASQTSAPSSGKSISKHDPSGRFPIRINLRTGETAAAAADKRKSAHAALMWLGWGFFLPLGLIMARFGKPLPCKIGGVPIWFQTHRAFQMTGLTLAIAAWVIGVFYIGSGTQTTHRGIGYFVMIAGCIQPLNALIRPHPPQPGQEPTQERKVWFFVHSWLGRSAVILGIVNMFIGIDILDPGAQYVGLLVASVVILGVLFIVLQIQAWFFPPAKATTGNEPKETPLEATSS